jgi:hypothetical protein
MPSGVWTIYQVKTCAIVGFVKIGDVVALYQDDMHWWWEASRNDKVDWKRFGF